MNSPQSVHPDVLAMRELLSTYPATENCQDCQQQAQLIMHPGGQVQSIAAPSLMAAPQAFIETLGGSSVDVASLATLYAGDMSGVCTSCASVAPTYFCGPLESSGDIYTSGSLIGCHILATCDLTVNGPTTLNGDLTVSGNTTLAGTLTVGGAPISNPLSALNQMIRSDATGNFVAIPAPTTSGQILTYNGTTLAWAANTGSSGAGSGQSGVNGTGGLQLYPSSGNLISGYPSGSGTASFTVGQNGTTTIGNTGSEGDLIVHGQLSVLPINPLADAVIVNAPASMAANLLNLEVNSVSMMTVNQNGVISAVGLSLNGSAVYPFGSTQTTAPANGTGGALPANASGWVTATLPNGTAILLPYWLAPVTSGFSSSPGIFSPGVASPGHA